MSIAESLVNEVKNFQAATGEDHMVVVVENHDETMGIHRIEFNLYLGLLVDGKPPSPKWYQDAERFHALQTAPAVLH